MRYCGESIYKRRYELKEFIKEQLLSIMTYAALKSCHIKELLPKTKGNEDISSHIKKKTNWRAK